MSLCIRPTSSQLARIYESFDAPFGIPKVDFDGTGKPIPQEPSISLKEIGRIGYPEVKEKVRKRTVREVASLSRLLTPSGALGLWTSPPTWLAVGEEGNRGGHRVEPAFMHAVSARSTEREKPPARLRILLLVFVSALIACAAPEIREDCRFVHEHIPPPPMPPGFAELDRELVKRLMHGTAAVRELSERPRLHTGIIPLQSFYASRNTVVLRRLFAEDFLRRFCARLEVARARAAAGQVREAGVAYQGLLLASQILQLDVALLQMAVYADEAGQPVAQIQQLALRPLVQLEPLLQASLSDAPERLAAELPAAVEYYNASVASLDKWAADLHLGAERVKIARVLWDTLLASAAAVEVAAIMAEAAAATIVSRGPPAALAAFAGGGGAVQLVLNKEVVIGVAGTLKTLIAAGALDGAVVAGLHAMASGTSIPPNVTRPTPIARPATEGQGHGGGSESAAVDDILRDATPGRVSKPGMGSEQYTKSGGYKQANKDFDSLTAGRAVREHGGGIRSGSLADGSTISVRPQSGHGAPTLQINPPTGNPTKIRYE